MENENARPLDPIENIQVIKKRINEISFAPLESHGELFDQVHRDLTAALSDIEGL